MPLEGPWGSQVECLGMVECKQFCPGPPLLGDHPWRDGCRRRYPRPLEEWMGGCALQLWGQQAAQGMPRPPSPGEVTSPWPLQATVPGFGEDLLLEWLGPWQTITAQQEIPGRGPYLARPPTHPSSPKKLCTPAGTGSLFWGGPAPGMVNLRLL